MNTHEISRTSKSSIVVDNNPMMIDLIKFAKFLASQSQDDRQVLMEYDELVGELLFEVSKGLKYYGDKSPDDLKNAVMSMMRNRLGELKYRYFLTHRRVEKLHISIDIQVDSADDDGAELGEIITDEQPTPESWVLSRERVEATRSLLSAKAQQVFDAIVQGDQKLSLLVWLSMMRAKAMHKTSTAKMRAIHVADALGMSEPDVHRAYKEIRKAYLEVCNG